MPEAVSVVFIMLDATRADRLSSFGNPHPTTPTLDRPAPSSAVTSRTRTPPGRRSRSS